jgi:hypothetical protein
VVRAPTHDEDYRPVLTPTRIVIDLAHPQRIDDGGLPAPQVTGDAADAPETPDTPDTPGTLPFTGPTPRCCCWSAPACWRPGWGWSRWSAATAAGPLLGGSRGYRGQPVRSESRRLLPWASRTSSGSGAGATAGT